MPHYVIDTSRCKPLFAIIKVLVHFFVEKFDYKLTSQWTCEISDVWYVPLYQKIGKAPVKNKK